MHVPSYIQFLMTSYWKNSTKLVYLVICGNGFIVILRTEFNVLIRVNHKLSDVLYVLSGVPQGSAIEGYVMQLTLQSYKMT